MSWVFYALLIVLFSSAKDVFSKFSLKTFDEYVSAWMMRLVAGIVALPFIILLGWPGVDTTFWIALAVGASLNTVSSVLYMRALKVADMSLTLPIIAFTPLFTLVVSPILVNEFPNAVGLLGIVLIVLGSYFLQIHKRKEGGWLAPLHALVHEPGPRYMLGVTLIWSVTSNIDKIGVTHSSPAVWSTFQMLGVALLLSMILSARKWRRKEHSKREPIPLRKYIQFLIPLGIFSGLAQISQMTAIEGTIVANVVAFKRLNIVVGVLMGYLFFRERNVLERLVASLIMVAGVVIISLYG